jgi:excisionase family DNA binding protein
MSQAELVKVGDAARSIGLNKHYLYKLAAAGKVPCYRAGRALRFCIPELLEWMRREAGDRKGVGVSHAH